MVVLGDNAQRHAVEASDEKSADAEKPQNTGCTSDGLSLCELCETFSAESAKQDAVAVHDHECKHQARNIEPVLA